MGTKLGSISSEVGDSIVSTPLVVSDKNGTTFNIEYLASKVTSKVFREMKQVQETGRLTPEIAANFCLSFLTVWDIEYNDKDEIIPLTVEGMDDVSLGIQGLIINAILQDMNPKKKK